MRYIIGVGLFVFGLAFVIIAYHFYQHRNDAGSGGKRPPVFSAFAVGADANTVIRRDEMPLLKNEAGPDSGSPSDDESASPLNSRTDSTSPSDSNSQSLEVKNESASRDRSAVVHVGWQAERVSKSEAETGDVVKLPRALKGFISVNDLQIVSSAHESAPVLNRVAFAVLLRSKSQRTKFWAVAGFLRAKNVSFIADEKLRRFYAVLKCEGSECLVLPEFQTSGSEPTERFAFFSEVADVEKSNFKIKWLSESQEVVFLRKETEWGRVKLPLRDLRITKQKFDVAHFIPASKSPLSLITKVQFKFSAKDDSH